MKKDKGIWYGIGLALLVFVFLAGAFLLTNTATATSISNEGEEMILYTNFAFYSSAFTTQPTKTLELELPETIIDESLILIPANANVFEQSVLIQQTELENFIDKQITAYDDQVKVTGKLLDVDGGRVYVETSEGVHALFPLGYVVPEYAKKKTLGIFKLDREDNRFKIYYAFSGLAWGTDYYLFINGKDGLIKARANIENNCGKDIENVKVRLVAGEVNYGQKSYPYPMYDMYAMKAEGAAPVGYEGKVEEFHVYELSSPISIKDKEKKAYEMYEEKMKVNKTLRYDTYGYDNEESALSTVYSFLAPREMPSGEVKVVADGMLVGADTIENKGKGSLTKLVAGKSFDVTGKTEMLDYKEGITSYEYSYKITIENHGTSTENIETNFHIYYGDWEIYDASDQPVEKTQDKITWKFSLGEGKKEITFKIRYKKL